MSGTTSSLQTWYNFLLAQMSAESYLEQWSSGERPLEDVLRAGNNNLDSEFIQGRLEEDYPGATRMTAVQVAQFNAEWQIIDHHANDETGFSATLLQDKGGTYTLSFRSTEYLPSSQGGDRERDLLPGGLNDHMDVAFGADGEIAMYGFAFGQVLAMEEYYADLIDRGVISAATRLNVTGYSLGAHLATVFTELHLPIVEHTYTFNASGRGEVIGEEGTQPERIVDMLARFKVLLQDANEGWSPVALNEFALRDEALALQNTLGITLPQSVTTGPLPQTEDMAVLQLAAQINIDVTGSVRPQLIGRASGSLIVTGSDLGGNGVYTAAQVPCRMAVQSSLWGRPRGSLGSLDREVHF